MRVRILGSGAGGGFPQWNCGCSNCRRYRSGLFRGSARSQVQLAISEDGDGWYLLSASPDLRYQIEGTPDLHPRAPGRNSPVRGVILSGADLDLCLGLLLLREWHHLDVYSTEGVRTAVANENSFFRVFERMTGQLRWESVSPGSAHTLDSFTFTLLPLPGKYPAWVWGRPPACGGLSARPLPPQEAVSGVLIETHSRKKLAFFPSLPAVTPELLNVLSTCATLFIDGTFWSEDELIEIEPNAKRASEIGHLPISGPHGSMAALSSLTGLRRIYIHINNTNPILDESSSQRRAVADAGWEVAFDGMELSL
jgi:pyrroloquinoline quinone biosynthesis protein B